ncbi:Ras guanine nucleotide exchange factor bud5 [Coemansia spiralis]|nr:Ras guanine nucleotide exchange factor bud5 [Coemansia spiralis]
MLKYFIELGIQLLALKNYDAVMAVKAAIYSASVMRLKRTWDILPEKFSLMCRRIHEAMDPDHNYANYRRLLRRSEPPFLPFLGLYLTDLTFIDDGNPTYRRFEEAPPAMPSQPSGQSDFHRLPPLQGSRLSSDGVSQSPQPLSQAATGPVQLVGQTCALFARRQDIDLNSRPILVNFEKAYRIAGVITEVQKFQVEYSGNFAMAIPGLQQYLIEQWTLYEAEGYDDDKIYSMSVNSEPRAMQISAGTRHHHHQGPLPPQQQQEQEQQEQPPSSMRLTRLLAGTQRLKHRDSLL